MPIYKLTGFTQDNFTVDTSGDSLFQEVNFASPAAPGESFTFLGGGGSIRMRVNEVNNGVADNQLEENTSDQTLDEAVTVGGLTFGPGTLVATGWRITMSGSDGETYQLSSITFGNSGNGNNPVYLLVFHNRMVPPDGTVLTVTQRVNGVAPNGIPYICFTAGTTICTVLGPSPVEALRVGDIVLTADNGPQPIRWIGRKRLSAAQLIVQPWNRPILLAAGRYGVRRNLILSPQHRICVKPRRDLLSAEGEVLCAAGHLRDGHAVRQILPAKGVEYVHLAFDQHQLIFANGTPAESLFIARQSLRSMSKAEREELRDLGLLSPGPAPAKVRRDLTAQEARLAI